MADYTKDEAIAATWIAIQQEPHRTTAFLDHLMNAKTFEISVDDYNAYDSTMTSHAQINIMDKRAADLEDVPGFSQVDTMSDDEILRVFQARDELNAKIDDIGRPPTDAEWYKVGLEAEQRIERLKPFYETMKEEEWEQLDPILPLMMMGAPTELVAGATDWRYDFKEKLHERGAFTSWNPLTGFGAWDIAEFNINPETGQRGFSPKLLQMEDEFEQLYGIKREYKSKMEEGRYRDVYGMEEEIGSLNQIIMENQLLDPRLLGETQ